MLLWPLRRAMIECVGGSIRHESDGLQQWASLQRHNDRVARCNTRSALEVVCATINPFYTSRSWRRISPEEASLVVAARGTERPWFV